MPYLSLDEEQYNRLLDWKNVFYHFRDTGVFTGNEDFKTVLRDIYPDIFQLHLNTECQTCLSRGTNQLLDKIEAYESTHKPVENA